MSEKLSFLFPIDGDCVDCRDGEVKNGTLFLRVRLFAPAGHRVTVCGETATETDGEYRVTIPVTAAKTVLTASDAESGEETSVTVFYLHRGEKHFRISSDDNILFLANIAAHPEYRSIFEDPYLAVYKEAHDRYGAKVHLNLFYSFTEEEAARFSTPRPYFDLSMMPDRFRAEWEANADWLHLSFHAAREFPDKPYIAAGKEQITRDCLAVHKEILRFAGEKTLADVMTVHWGEATREGVRALRDVGYRALAGYFEYQNGNPLVAYYTKAPLLDHIGERDFFVDTTIPMLFGRIDLVLNSRTMEDRMARFAEILAHPHKSNFVSLMIHEQYFYSDYRLYLPDFKERVLEPCRVLAENGYTGMFMGEVAANLPEEFRS